MTMNDKFAFQLHINTFYGVGQSRTLGKLLHEKNFQRVLILADEGCANSSDYFGEIGVYPISEKAWIDVGQWAEYRKALQTLESSI